MSPSSVFALAGRRSFVILLAGVLLNTLPLCGFEAPAIKPKGKATDFWSVRWQPVRLVNGSPLVFQVTSPEQLKSLSAKWLEHEVFLSSDSHGKVWYGIAGASLETRPGNYSLALKGATITGKELSFQKRIAVGKGKYHSIVASVPKQYTEPNAEQLQRINQDKVLKEHAFARTTSEREWAGSFHPAVKAQISDVFGTSRTFNGRVQSVHQGLDYAVPEGTPVAALNSGTVLLAQPLFFEGNCVVLDHGQGLLTLYMHLSKIEVKEGDRITGGQKIGLSGGTGRATGPHLHVAVRWQGVYLNPATLLSLRLP
ncbi:MAG TPA: M23 family metallopeptidase [Terriglobales bacterium]|nr:M23 family metallopeptidase [Terriglobales bacterium]